MDLTASTTEAFKRSNQAKRDEQNERAKTLEKWYGLQKQELTKDLENELSILRLRRYMHSTSFVKTADFKSLPKYFAVGFYYLLLIARLVKMSRTLYIARKRMSRVLF